MQVCTWQITTPAPHHSVFTGRMLFLPPNQQHQSNGPRKEEKSLPTILYEVWHPVLYIFTQSSGCGRETKCHCQPDGCKKPKQLANIVCASAEPGSHPQQDRKWASSHLGNRTDRMTTSARDTDHISHSEPLMSCDMTEQYSRNVTRRFVGCFAVSINAMSDFWPDYTNTDHCFIRFHSLYQICINGLISRTIWVSPYQTGKTIIDFYEARENGYLDGCGIDQTICKHSAPCFRGNHANIWKHNFLRARCSSWRPTNSVKALKELQHVTTQHFL